MLRGAVEDLLEEQAALGHDTLAGVDPLGHRDPALVLGPDPDRLAPEAAWRFLDEYPACVAVEVQRLGGNLDARQGSAPSVTSAETYISALSAPSGLAPSRGP